MIVVTEVYLGRVLDSQIYQTLVEVKIDSEIFRYVHEERLYSEVFLEQLRCEEKIRAQEHIMRQIRGKVFGL